MQIIETPEKTAILIENLKCYIQITGMTCASCVAAIEKHTLKMNGMWVSPIYFSDGKNTTLIFLCISYLGVSKVLVALMAGKAEVFYDKFLVTPQAICDWISALGFPSSLQSDSDPMTKNGVNQENGKAEAELHIGGMTCSSCVYNIESHVAKMNGIIQARVALSTQKGVFTYDPDRVGPRQIIDQIIVSANYCSLVNQIVIFRMIRA